RVASVVKGQLPVVGKGVRLNEAGRIGGIPCAFEVLPLPAHTEDGLNVVRQVLGERGFQKSHDDIAPGSVALLVHDATVRVDPPEAAEWLQGPVRIEPVDVDERVAVPKDPPGARHIEADLPWKLFPEADHELVDERLMKAGIEFEP